VRYDESQVCRGLLIDTHTGRIVMADASGRVRRARRAGRWLRAEDVLDTVDESPRYHGIYSAFDLPTVLLFERFCGEDLDPADLARLLAAIRHDLDRAHTRGEFKARVERDIEGLVRPARDNVAALFRLRASGRRLFVVTNSQTHYAVSVLDHLFGAGVWREVFDVVVTDARKPFMFDELARATGEPWGGVVEGLGAAALEALLGAGGRSVMYVGDNPAFDASPARRFGWTSALVVPEMSRGEGAWGPPLGENGRASWLGGLITGSAHVWAPSFADFLSAFLEAGESP
jgi:FMN phosphatase YigB (HAD superfamily)